MPHTGREVPHTGREVPHTEAERCRTQAERCRTQAERCRSQAERCRTQRQRGAAHRQRGAAHRGREVPHTEAERCRTQAAVKNLRHLPVEPQADQILLLDRIGLSGRCTVPHSLSTCDKGTLQPKNKYHQKAVNIRTCSLTLLSYTLHTAFNVTHTQLCT